MATRKVAVGIEVTGRDAVKRALTGTVEDARGAAAKAAREESKWTRAAQSEARARQKAHESADNAVTASARKSAKAATQAERDRAREVERTARTEERAAKRKQNRARERRSEQARGDDGMSSGVAGAAGIPIGAAAIATAAAGAVVAMMSAVDSRMRERATSLEAAAGTRAPDQAMTDRLSFDTNLARVGQEAFGAGMTNPEFAQHLDEVRSKIEQVAVATRQDPGALLEGLTLFQEKFSDFDFGLSSMEEIARFAESSGDSFASVADMVGEFRRQARITGADTGDALGLVARQQQLGSVTSRQLATDFAPTLGSFTAFTGRRGMAGLGEFGATAQLISAGGNSTAESATRFEAMMRSLSDVETQKRLRRAGVRVNERDGSRRMIPDIITDIANAPRLQTSEQLQGVFTDIRGREGVGALVRQVRNARREGSANPFAAFGVAPGQGTAGVDALAEAGVAFNTQKFQRVATTAGEINRARAIGEGVTLGGQGTAVNADMQRQLSFRSVLRESGMVGQILSDLPGVGSIGGDLLNKLNMARMGGGLTGAVIQAADPMNFTGSMSGAVEAKTAAANMAGATPQQIADAMTKAWADSIARVVMRVTIADSQVPAPAAGPGSGRDRRTEQAR